ncbi:MAG TPA: PilZ domain-containing protein [Terriglobales bacterium]|nr:PilZ domain-containing protein [Terriglobales bacterium]
MLRSILLSCDDETVRILTRGFKGVEVELCHCSDAKTAIARAQQERFDAIVLDDHVAESHKVLENVIEFSTCNKAVRIVLAEPSAPLHAIFKTGTQVILYKPLSPERVRHGLRAVRNLMARERRRGSKRVHTMVPARISPRHARNATRQVLIADLSESGAAIHFESGDMPLTGTLNLEFALPGSPERIHCTAEVVWHDHHGVAGTRFLDMPSYARKQLAHWVKEQVSKDSAASLAAHAGR